MSDIFIRIIDMPAWVNGQIIVDENGDYNIYLNARYGPDEIKKTLQHEMLHIARGDFYGERDISEIEVC